MLAHNHDETNVSYARHNGKLCINHVSERVQQSTPRCNFYTTTACNTIDATNVYSSFSTESHFTWQLDVQ